VPYDARFVVPFFFDVRVVGRIRTCALTFKLDEAFVSHPIGWLDCVACFYGPSLSATSRGCPSTYFSTMLGFRVCRRICSTSSAFKP